jgi:hypothetical protein
VARLHLSPKKPYTGGEVITDIWGCPLKGIGILAVVCGKVQDSNRRKCSKAGPGGDVCPHLDSDQAMDAWTTYKANKEDTQNGNR